MAFTLQLRNYQEQSIEALREGIRQGHRRQILCAPTGAGKSVVAAYLIQEAINKHSRTYFIVDRLALLDQSLALFDSYGIESGVIQAKHWKWRPQEYLQIASVGTIARRGIAEDLKLAIVDECHIQSQAVTQFILRHPELIVVGLSASPFTKGLGRVYTNVVNVTSTDQLVSEGWLVPTRAFVCKAIDVKGLKIAADGEWDEGEITKRSMTIVGDVVTEWVKKTNEIFGGPVKTILFSATVDHGAALCKQFQAEGHNFVQVSYRDKNDQYRRDIIEEFRKPDSNITGLCSVEALSRGFDVTDIKVGVFCRPYRKSLSAWIQQLGRIMRPHPEKTFAVALDHANNFLRFLPSMQEFFAEGISKLDDGKHEVARKEPQEWEVKARTCQGCGFTPLTAAMQCCPHCGREIKHRNTLQHIAGEMHEIDLGGKKKKEIPEWMRDKESVARQLWTYALKIKGDDQEAARRFANMQFKVIYNEWPYRKIETLEPMPPDQALINMVRHNLIRWSKSRV